MRESVCERESVCVCEREPVCERERERESPPRAMPARKVDVRLPGKGNSNSHGARPVHLMTTRIKWIRTSDVTMSGFGVYTKSMSLCGC